MSLVESHVCLSGTVYLQTLMSLSHIHLLWVMEICVALECVLAVLNFSPLSNKESNQSTMCLAIYMKVVTICRVVGPTLSNCHLRYQIIFFCRVWNYI